MGIYLILLKYMFDPLDLIHIGQADSCQQSYMIVILNKWTASVSLIKKKTKIKKEKNFH